MSSVQLKMIAVAAVRQTQLTTCFTLNSQINLKQCKSATMISVLVAFFPP